MRSNDIAIGMLYDVFNFTMLQELLAVELDVELGTYTHMVGSLHIYEKSYNLLKGIRFCNTNEPISMTPLPKEAVSKVQISELLSLEEALRKNIEYKAECELHEYWNQFAQILKYKNHIKYGKQKKDINLDELNNCFSELLA
jgi:thymidylate synthase